MERNLEYRGSRIELKSELTDKGWKATICLHRAGRKSIFVDMCEFTENEVEALNRAQRWAEVITDDHMDGSDIARSA